MHISHLHFVVYLNSLHLVPICLLCFLQAEKGKEVCSPRRASQKRLTYSLQVELLHDIVSKLSAQLSQFGNGKV